MEPRQRKRPRVYSLETLVFGAIAGFALGLTGGGGAVLAVPVLVYGLSINAPGHGAGSLCGTAIGSRNASSLGYERRFNVSLKEAGEDQWVNKLLEGMPIAPPYFRRMKKVNAEGPAVIGYDLPGKQRFSAAEVHQRVCEHCPRIENIFHELLRVLR